MRRTKSPRRTPNSTVDPPLLLPEHTRHLPPGTKQTTCVLPSHCSETGPKCVCVHNPCISGPRDQGSYAGHPRVPQHPLQDSQPHFTHRRRLCTVHSSCLRISAPPHLRTSTPPHLNITRYEIKKEKNRDPARTIQLLQARNDDNTTETIRRHERTLVLIIKYCIRFGFIFNLCATLTLTLDRKENEAWS